MFGLIPKSKLPDLFLVFLIFVTGSFISYIFGVGLFVYNLIVLLPASLFLLSRNSISSKKVFVQGVLLGLFAEILVDSFAIASHAWVSPTDFSFTIIGLPIENYIWNILYVIFMMSFYEYFFDRYKTKKLSKNNRVLLLVIAGVSIVFPLIYIYFPASFIVSYFYLILVIILFVLEVIGYIYYRNIVIKSFVMGLLLLPLSFIHEITSLEYRHWFFEQGNHIFYIPLLSFQVPIEEIFFYLAGPIAVILFYELLIDNGKG